MNSCTPTGRVQDMNGTAYLPTGCAKLAEQRSEVLPIYTLPPPVTIAMQAATFNIPSHLLSGFRT